MTAWRDVEVAAAEQLDGPSEADLQAIRTATFTVDAVKERERVTDHDVAAFVDVLGASAGRGRALDPLRADVLRRARHRARAAAPPRGRRRAARRARASPDALAERAREHAGTLCVGRTHGVHAEPTSFGLKLAGFAFEAYRNAERLERAFAQASVGAISGAVGTYASLGPDYERRVLATLGLEAEDGLDPGRAARPPRRAAAGHRARRRRARALRDGDPPPAAHRGARGRGAVPRRAEGLERDAAQAQPDRHRADHRPGPRAARLRAGGRGGRRALARARHLALRRRAGDPARRDDRARLHAGARDPRRRGHGRPHRTGCGRTSRSPAARCSPSGCCSRWWRAAWRATTRTGSSSAWPSRRGTRRRRCASCSTAEPGVELDLDAIFDYGHYIRHVPEVSGGCPHEPIAVLIHGAPAALPDLFHVIPAAIGDPFLYLEAAAAAPPPVGALDAGPVEALGIEVLDPYTLGLDDLIAAGATPLQRQAGVALAACRALGIDGGARPGGVPARPGRPAAPRRGRADRLARDVRRAAAGRRRRRRSRACGARRRRRTPRWPSRRR